MKRNLNTECQDGYFPFDSYCYKWHESCHTWIKENEWLSWNNKILNSSTKLWEFCPDGQFYSSSLSECVSWGDSWLENWAYQEKWFQCPEGEKFQLGII